VILCIVKYYGGVGAVIKKGIKTMKIRMLLLIPVCVQLGGCIATPRIELAERIDFNYMQPDQRPLSFDDMLCCYGCQA
jgi:hypothetical protein